MQIPSSGLVELALLSKSQARMQIPSSGLVELAHVCKSRAWDSPPKVFPTNVYFQSHQICPQRSAWSNTRLTTQPTHTHILTIAQPSQQSQRLRTNLSRYILRSRMALQGRLHDGTRSHPWTSLTYHQACQACQCPGKAFKKLLEGLGLIFQACVSRHFKAHKNAPCI